MNRYLVQSTNFSGQVEALFRNNHLCRIDFTDTNLDPVQKASMLNNVVSIFEENFLENCKKYKQLTVVQAAFEVSFDDFWHVYGKKINRKRCLKIWESMSKVNQVRAWAGVKVYKKYLKNTGYRNEVDPERYLKDEFFNNEY